VGVGVETWAKPKRKPRNVMKMKISFDDNFIVNNPGSVIDTNNRGKR
jgi:hypothetical protein